MSASLAVCLVAAPGASAELSFDTEWGGPGLRSPEGLDVDSAGNVYVADTANHRVQKFDPSGAPIAAWGSQGSADGSFSFPRKLVVDSQDRIYVADSGNHRVQKFDSDGTFLAKWGSNGSSHGQLSTPYGIAVDSSDNVYVVELGNNRIQKFDSDGTFLSMWGWGVDTGAAALEVCDQGSLPCQAGSSGSGDGQLGSPVDVGVSPGGDLYVAEAGNHRIHRFSTSGAFLGKWGLLGSGHGQFASPWGVAADAAGNVYVADRGRARVQKFEADGTFVAMWGWRVDTGADMFEICTAASTPCQSGQSGSSDGQFRQPDGIATDSAGNILVADRGNHRVQRFDSNGGFLSKWGPGEGRFDLPSGAATDATGNVYVADREYHRIQRFDPAGTFLGEWGSMGTVDGQFLFPSALAVNQDTGHVYVGDAGSNRVQVFDSGGAFLGKWGSAGAAEGQFGTPRGIAVDASGDVYVADTDNRRIQKFDADGNFLATWGWGVDTGAAQFEICDTSSTPCQAGASGSGAGQFNAPRELALDQAGSVYVADHLNHRIQKFDADGNFLATWGWGVDDGNAELQICDASSLPCQAGSQGAGDGQFNQPIGLATSSLGAVYVADSVNGRIQKFDAEGAFLGKLGSSGSGEGQFSFPESVTTDPAGNVIVADTNNRRIQKFAISFPGTAIDSEPDGLSNDATPEFTFSSTTAGVSFQCRLFLTTDPAPAFGPCSGPGDSHVPDPALADGEYTFEVRALDSFADADPTPPSVSFTVDTTPPVTAIDSGPGDGSTINDPSPSFEFSADEPATFECRLYLAADTPPAFGPCSGPGDTHTPAAPLADGSYTFEVLATDLAGNPDPTPPSVSFTVDTTPPPDPPPGGGPPPAAEQADLPAALTVNRAQIRNRRLAVRGSLNPAAAGERVVIRLRAQGRNLTLRPTVQPDGRFSVNRRLKGPQRRAKAGRLNVRFAGNDTLRAAGQRLRAAARAVRLRVTRLRIRGARLEVAGRAVAGARGEARILIKFNRPNGQPAQIATSAKLNRRGRFSTRRPLPAAARASGAQVSIAHPGRGRFFGQRIGRGVGG